MKAGFRNAPSRNKVFFSVVIALLGTKALADNSLSLDHYLEQVKNQNKTYQGAVSQKEGAKERISEKDVVLAPSLFANASLSRDAKLPQLLFYSYDRIDSQIYQLGVSKQTTFGLQGRVYYELDYTDFVNSNLGILAGPSVPLQFYDARPVIELTQSLWQNGFGSAIRANQDLLEAQAQSDHYTAENQLEHTLLDAETAYWRLAVARQSTKIETTAVEQAEEIYNFVSQRAKMNLGDKGDVLQAKANLESQRLQLMAAQNEEVSAARNFNSFRNITLAQVSEELAALEWERLENMAAPTTHGTRADVKAAEATARATSANAKLLAEKDKPVLDLSASYALNGRDVTIPDTLNNSYTAGRPTFTAGLKFSLPLDFGAVSDARNGATREQIAAELTYQQKALDQEQQWLDLVAKLSNARDRLSLARTIVTAQREKVAYERTRLKQGRTTTYQVLLFEQDFSQAELAQTRVASELLTLLAQVKLYEGDRL
jgi:outer membrane protein TolC